MKTISFWMSSGLALIVALLFTALVNAAESPKPLAMLASAAEEAQVTADSFEYLPEGLIHAKGHVVVRYRGCSLYAAEITYNDKTKIVESPRLTRVKFKQFEVIGEKAIVNLDTQAGQFENAHAIVDFGPFQEDGRWYDRKWYAYGKKVIKDPNTKAFHIEDGRATTCPPEYRSPLYYIQAKKLSILPPEPGDTKSQARIVGRNCYVRFENMPILWLPQVTYTVREDDNQSPIQVAAGYTSEKGAFVDTYLDVFRSQYLRLTPHLGFFSKHGISMGLDGTYYYAYTNVTTLSGSWKTFFLEDASRQFIIEQKTESNDGKQFRYRFLWEHTQTFGPGAGWLKDGVLMGEMDLLSDIDLVQDFYRTDYQKHGERETWFDFTKPIGENNEVSIYAVKQVNTFYSTYERLPELRHIFKKSEILRIKPLDVPVYYESKTRAGYYDYSESDEINGNTGYSLWRAWTDQKISAPKRFLGFLNFEPFLGLQSDFGYVGSRNTGESVDYWWHGAPYMYSKRKPPMYWLFDYNRISRVPINMYGPDGEGAMFRIMPYGGADMSFKMHRTYDFEGTYAGQVMRRWLGADSEKIRHVIEPKMRGLGTAGLGTESGVAGAWDVGVRNAFQIERNGHNVDLADITIMHSLRGLSGDLFDEPVIKKKYRFYPGIGYRMYDEEELYAPTHAVGADINASPFDWLDIDSDVVWDMDKYNRITVANLNTHSDVSWLVQRMFASPYMTRSLRGRKDEVKIDVSYRYLYEHANLISTGARIWFDDFTPLLSDRMQRKSWAREWTRGWGTGCELRFESKSGTLQEIEYSIYKNWKKCLDTEVTARYRDGEYAILATFWLTAYPGLKLETGY